MVQDCKNLNFNEYSWEQILLDVSLNKQLSSLFSNLRRQHLDIVEIQGSEGEFYSRAGREQLR